MKIAEALDIAAEMARNVLADMVREHKGPALFGTVMMCYRGEDPVAMLALPPSKEVILQTAFLVARGFGPDLIALTHDTFIAPGPEKGKVSLDPRTGKIWDRNPGDAPGPMQTYVDEFGYDGTVLDALVTHAVNRAGDAAVVPEPYKVVGRTVCWPHLEGLDTGRYDDDGVQRELVRVMGMTTLDQVMPGVLPEWAQAMAAHKPEMARWSYDMATVALIEDYFDGHVVVSLFAEKGSPRDQLFKSRFPRSQVIDPSRWN